MKKFLLLILVTTLSLPFLNAQGNIQLFDHNGNYVTNGQRLSVYVEDVNAFEVISEEYFIRNNSSEDMNIKCVRDVLYAVEGTNNSFCAMGLCYTPSVDETPSAYLLTANTTIASEFPFSAHYSPNGIAGTTEIAYKFYDVENPNDSISFSIQFSEVEVTQNSLQLFDSEGNQISYGTDIEVSVDDLGSLTDSHEYFIRNNSDRELTLLCKRTVLENVEGNDNYFCALGACLPPDGDVAGPQVVDANTTVPEDDPFSSHYLANNNPGKTKLHYRFYDQNNEFNEFSFTVTFDGTTGLHQMPASETRIAMFPNPAQDFVNLNISELDIPNAYLMLYNTLGELVMSVPVNQNGMQKIDVSSLVKGVYLYRLEGGLKQSNTFKISIF